MMYWLEVSVTTDGEAAETVAEVLRPFAYNDGVVLEQWGDTGDLDPNALEPTVTVKIYIPEAQDTPALRQRISEILYHLNRLYPIPPPTFRELIEEDWANAWKAHYRPFRVGKHIWIQPGWTTADDDPEQRDSRHADDVVITLDPGMAFGTGLHPTTQMCLQALEQVVQPGMRVLDVGTGSGILAIAAAKLAATDQRRLVTVMAVDTDEVAVKAATANVALNDVAGQVTVRQGELGHVTEKAWDVVVVNILAPVIITLLRDAGLLTYLAPDGRLILSGIIDQQANEVETSIAHAGGTILETMTIRDWITYVARRA